MSQDFKNTLEHENEQEPSEREKTEKIKNEFHSSAVCSGFGILSPITECDPVEQFTREIKTGSKCEHNSTQSNNSNQIHSSTTSTQLGTDDKKCSACETVSDKDLPKRISNEQTAVSVSTEGGKSEMISSSDSTVNNLTIDEDTPPPVAPPRRKRKKKPNNSTQGEVCVTIILFYIN